MAVVGDIFKEAGESIIGSLAKAKIEISDTRVNEVKVIDIVNNANKKVLFAKDVFETVEVGNITDKVKEIKERLPKDTKRIYTVRFNPSELSINAIGGGKAPVMNYDDSEHSQVDYVEVGVNIQLSVRLIFDDMSITDSFMNEAIAIKNAVKKTYHTIKETRNSVQAQVEGFIGALRNSHTRSVKFHWGEMVYEGVLNYMNAEYTMFSIHGRPVRAHVDLGILCSDKKLNGDNMGNWKKAYEDAFASDGVNLESAGQNVGNLFNINL